MAKITGTKVPVKTWSSYCQEIGSSNLARLIKEAGISDEAARVWQKVAKEGES